MANENKNQEFNSLDIDDNFDEIETSLTKELEASLLELEGLEQDREMIDNPDSLGKVILDEIWTQFGNQIGLDMTNETLIQEYDRKHPEAYKDIANSVLQDKKYKDANKDMKSKLENGTLRDEYTGKTFGKGETANLDHVVPRKEIFENQRRKQAGLSVAELANRDENLQATNESLNKSKGAKSNKEYVAGREQRENKLSEQNEKRNKKIDKANISDNEKKHLKEKNNKRLEDKRAADDNLMLKKDKEARAGMNKKIVIEGTKNVGKKAAKDAVKAMAVSALFSLLKEIMNGFVAFLKEKNKSFKSFLDKMKVSIKSFFEKILSTLKTGTSTLLGTVLSELFGHIVSVFKKASSLIKQGISSVRDAIKYLKDKENKNKPLSVKVAQIGKIMTAAIVGGSALVLGEIFEDILFASVPGMQIEIPLVGTLANIIGLFLASLISGIIGAIIMNFIDKFIAKKLKAEKTDAAIDKGNEILNIQEKQVYLYKNKVNSTRDSVMSEIEQNHSVASEMIRQSLENIFAEDEQDEDVYTENQRELDKMQVALDEGNWEIEQMQNDLADLL